MAVSLENKKRHIIPRWRNSKLTLWSNELLPVVKTHPNEFELIQLEHKVEQWNKNKTLYSATDLLGSAYVLNRLEIAKEASEFILAPNSLASELAKNLAYIVLNNLDLSSSNSEEILRPEIQIRELKKRLNNEPRNAIINIDLARLYTSIGLNEKAEKYIKIALGIHPNNRFILRTASRFFVHNNEPDRAHSTLLKSESLLYDPWLLAAEIAITLILGKTSKHLKKAHSFIDSLKIDPIHISELASSLGSYELMRGNLKGSKKYFKKSLIAPNDNSFAQMIWASNEYHLGLSHSTKNIPFLFEANARTNRIIGEWNIALEEGKRWSLDEPFSSLPVIFNSYILAVPLEDFKSSEMIIRQGLKVNPRDSTLLNNLAFSLANQNNIQEAEKAILSIDIGFMDIVNTIPIIATTGLILFKAKEYEKGREFYLKSIDLAIKNNFLTKAAMASINLALEEIIIDSDQKEVAFNRAIKYANKIEDLDINILKQRLIDRYHNSLSIQKPMR